MSRTMEKIQNPRDPETQKTSIPRDKKFRDDLLPGEDYACDRLIHLPRAPSITATKQTKFGSNPANIASERNLNFLCCVCDWWKMVGSS